MHTVTNFFIGNLAMADVIIGLLSIPFQFQAAVLQRWALPRFMCSFCPFIQILSVNVSIFTLTAIAIDRHKAILNPLRARSSKHASKICILIIWMASLLLAAPISYGLKVVDLMIQYDISESWPNYFASRKSPFPSWTLLHFSTCCPSWFTQIEATCWAVVRNTFELGKWYEILLYILCVCRGFYDWIVIQIFFPFRQKTTAPT